jgi:hypothetical protein
MPWASIPAGAIRAKPRWCKHKLRQNRPRPRGLVLKSPDFIQLFKIDHFASTAREAGCATIPAFIRLFGVRPNTDFKNSIAGRVVVNNATFQTADRGTHLKIVAVSLFASLVIMIAGIAASNSSFVANSDLQARGPVVKATKDVVITRNEMSVIR